MSKSFLSWIFPPQASALAPQIDYIYFALVGLTVVLTAGIALAIAVLAYWYRRRSPDEAGKPVLESVWIEIIWSVIPLVICLGIFAWGTKVYLHHIVVPEDALEISVVGKQWMWKFQHPGGRREINELHIPLGAKVHIRMISQDVIHSLYFPAFRVKQDALPLYYTSLWFEPTMLGRFHIHCAEYCGKDHSAMGGHVYVLEPAEYERWLRSGTGMDQQPALPMLAGVGAGAVNSPLSRGQKLFDTYACASCHLSSGKGQGPTHVGLYGSKVELADGTVVTADDNYIRNSILNPNAQVVKGFTPVMPSFQGRISEEEINDLIEFIKSRRAP